VKILLLQLKRIGDLIQTTPVVRALREAFPSAHLTLAVDDSASGLLEMVDADEKWIYRKGSLKANRWLYEKLPFFRGEACLDFTGTDRSALLAGLSRARRRITYARFRGKFFRRWIYTDFVDSPVRERHTADHHLDLLRPLGIQMENMALDLRLPIGIAERLPALPPEFAVIHAGTARPEKYWVAERWAEVARFLQASHGLPTVLTGSTDPAERRHLAAIQAAAGGVCTDLAGQTGLAELAAVISRAQIFCGVDTAAMHLADAMRTPALALFGPTNPYHWRPRHTKSAILRAQTTLPFAPAQKGGPMESISAAAVCASIQALLAPAET